MAIRRELIFLLLAVFVVTAESMVLASRAYAMHPEVMRAAVIFDLSVVPALIWWLFFRNPRTTARVAVLGIALAALLFGREVRLLAAPIELGIMYIAYTSIRKALRMQGDVATALGSALGNSIAARAVATEMAVLWYALFSWGRKAPEGFSAYKRAGWGAIYVAVGIASLGEAVGVHFLVRRFGPAATISAAALHIYFLLWMLGDYRALELRPIEISGALLKLRIGLRWEGELPLRLIEAVDSDYTSGLRLGILGAPNLHLKLREPVELRSFFGITRRSDSLLLQVDDPTALAAALR
jgi:hypothetical protein